MNDHGLLKAILDDPEDDVPRLAFADWRGEQGDEARSEFIRVQMERHRLPSWDERQSELAARERRLLSAHGTAWVPETTALFRFRRGFAERVGASLAVLEGIADALDESHPVREVVLREDPQARPPSSPFWRRVRWLSFEFDETEGNGGVGQAIAACSGICPPSRISLSNLLSHYGTQALAGLLATPAFASLDRLEASLVHVPAIDLMPLAEPGRFREVSFDGHADDVRSSIARVVETGAAWGQRWAVHSGNGGDLVNRQMISDLVAGHVEHFQVGTLGMLDLLLDAPSWGALRSLRILFRGSPEDDWDKRLVRHPGYARLRMLHVYGILQEMPTALLDGDAPELEILHFGFARINGREIGLRAKGSLLRPGAFPRLREASLPLATLPDAEVRAVLSSPLAARLRTLHLKTRASAVDSFDGWANLAAANSVTVDLLNGADAAPVFRSLLRANGLPHLTGVGINGGGMTRTDGLVDLCLSTPRLTELHGDWYRFLPDAERARLEKRFWTPSRRLRVLENE